MALKFKNHLITIVILLVAMWLTACSPAPPPPLPAVGAPADGAKPPPQPPEGNPALNDNEKILRLFYHQAPTSLNPHLTTSLKDVDAARISYEPLASYNADGDLIPFLAETIPTTANGGVAEDGRSVTWRLRKGVKWSDGEPFTADDVRFTYEYITNPDVNAGTANIYAQVKDVEVVDDHTVRIHFTDPNPAWPLVFVGAKGMILPRHIFEAYNNDLAENAPPNTNPVGTGPYKIVKFQPEGVLFLGNDLIETKRLIYERNPFYYGEEEPFFDRVELKGGSDNIEAIYAVLESEIADFAWNLTLESEAEVKELEAKDYGRIVAIPGPRVERILLNRTDPNKATASGEQSSLTFPHPILSDLKVRQALNLAIDRDAVAALATLATATSNNLVSPASYNSANTSYEYNLEKAAALLDEAGWTDQNGDGIREKDGESLTLTFQTTAGNSLREKIQDMYRESLAEIGVDVKLSTVSSGVLYGNDTNLRDHYHQFQTDLQLYRLGNGSPDPGPYMQQWVCDEIPQQSNNWTGENVERWCNPAYDELYEASTKAFDFEKRRDLFIEMNDMLIEDVVMIPLLNRGTFSAVGNSLKGVSLHAWAPQLWNIRDWYREETP